MADFPLIVGMDVNASYTEFQKGISTLVNQLNGKPPQIKVEFDKASLASMRTEIENLHKSIASGMSKASVNTAGINQVATEARAAAGAVQTMTQAMHTQAAAAKQTTPANKSAESAIKAYNSAIVQGEAALRNWSAAAHSMNASSRQAYKDLSESVDAMRNAHAAYRSGAGSVDKLRQKTEAYRATLKTTEQALKANGDATKSLTSRLGGLANKFSAWLGVTQVIMTAVRGIRRMVSASVELDSAMTQMQIVTKASTSEMEAFGNAAAKVAQRTASSISDVVDSATTYARLGYTMGESTQLAEFTAMLQNVGDIDVSSAQDAITSIVKAFNVDTSQIESVMDKLVETGNHFPISVAQIAEGMNNASSTLAAAGNTFEQSVALLTAANVTIQDAAKSSTGLRTIAARIRNTKTELDDLGETMTEANYEELVSTLTDAQVALTDINGEYRSTYDIMSDIAAKWNEMTSMEQAALATALSGTRQQAVFYSIIEQFQEASGAMDAMANSTGALSDAYDVYLESVQAHIDRFKASFESLSQSTMTRDFLNFFIDLGTGIVNITEKVGLLGTALSLISARIVVKNFDSSIEFVHYGCEHIAA